MLFFIAILIIISIFSFVKCQLETCGLIRENIIDMGGKVNHRVTQRDLYNAINEFRHEVNGRLDKWETHCVTKEEFCPVRNIVYGGVGLILTAVVLAIIGLVLIT